MSNFWIVPLLHSVSDIYAPNNKILLRLYLVKTVCVKKNLICISKVPPHGDLIRSKYVAELSDDNKNSLPYA